MTNNNFDRIEAKRKLVEIFEIVKSEIESTINDPLGDKIGLYGGNMGIALFLYEYAQYDKSTLEENYATIVKLIEEAFHFIRETENLPRSLCNGLIGTLCTINYLKQKNILKLEDDYVSEEIIKFLEMGSLKDTLQFNNGDLLHGGFGFMFYLIENPNLPNWDGLIKNQLDALTKIALSPSLDRINWKMNSSYLETNPLSEDPNGVNLGLAHGICGIVILLAKLKQTTFSTKLIDESIEKGMNLILSTKLKNVESTSLFPTTIVNNKLELNSRLAWCYGDLCIALAAWHSWKATGKKKYKNISLEIMDHSALIDPVSAKAVDCGICHGTSGISHIFRHFYIETNKKEYDNAANFWINETLKMAKFKDGHAGYKAYRPQEYGGPSLELGILEGVSGIGLTLITALTGKNGGWDKFFLIS